MKPIEEYSKLKIFIVEQDKHKYRIYTRKTRGGCRAELFDILTKDLVAAYDAKVSFEEFYFDIKDLAQRYNNAEIK